jgi:hypothetical protein
MHCLASIFAECRAFGRSARKIVLDKDRFVDEKFIVWSLPSVAITSKTPMSGSACIAWHPSLPSVEHLGQMLEK